MVNVAPSEQILMAEPVVVSGVQLIEDPDVRLVVRVFVPGSIFVLAREI
jgi:hypothetical protein